MPEDRLKEQSEMSSLDHMASLGKAALTAGVGAALFYRAGGSRLLSDGTRISARFLNEAKNEVAKLDKRNLTTEQLKRAYGNLFGPSEGALSKIKREVQESSTISLRVDDPRNLIGGLSQSFLPLDSNPRMILRQMFNAEEIAGPTAREFVRKFAPDDPVLGRRIERFVFDAVNNLNDIQRIREISIHHKVNKELSRSQIDEIVDFASERVRKTDFDTYVKEHQNTLIEAAREAINPDNLERVFGSVDRPTARQQFFDRVLGDTRATVKDLLENEEKFANNPIFFKKSTDGAIITDDAVESFGGSEAYVEAIKFLRQVRENIAKEFGEEAVQKFERLYVDGTLRKNRAGEIYSFKESAMLSNAFLNEAAGTMPGKILKLRDIAEMAKAPKFLAIPASGSLSDPILARIANKQAPESLLPESHHLRIYDRVYSFSREGLDHVEELDDTVLVSRYGTIPRMIKQISGDVDYRVGSNRVFRWLDIAQDGTPTILDNLKSRVSKFQDYRWRGNVIEDLLKQSEETFRVLSTRSALDEMSDEIIEDALVLTDRIRGLNQFFSKNTYKLNSEAVAKLIPHTQGQARHTLELLQLDNEELLKNVLLEDLSSIRSLGSHLNQDLVSLLNKYIMSPRQALDSISIKTNQGNFFGGNQTDYFFDLLRMEIGKEAFMQHALQNARGGRYNFDAVAELIENAGLTGEVRRETKRLANWAAFQQATETFSLFTRNKDASELLDTARRVSEVFLEPVDESAMNAEFFRAFREDLLQMSKEKINPFETSFRTFQETTDIINSNNLNNYIHIKKAISPLDLIKDINNTEKWKAFAKQFGAGRSNLEDVTTATIFPYFMLFRLSDALAPIGLSLSVHSTGSVAQMASAMLFKRGLPIAAGLTYLDYLSDMTKEITGTSIYGAVGNTIANTDLAFRRFTDATGLTSFLKDEAEINPFYQYFFGDEYRSYEEQAEWYRTGYSEMRKGRWWSFGSLNEFRGSEIAYFQPNWLRRIHADARDVSLYDSVWEKWSRSWFPTPTAPFSPIMYLINPYWLEEKHMEDRPYPISGPLFSETTPWGPILNPTIGELIKPRRRYHTDRLDSNWVDVKSLIEERNRAILEKARGENNLVRLNDGVIEPVTFTSLNAPTPSERVLQISSGPEGINVTAGGYGIFTGVMDAQDFIQIYEGIEFSEGDGESGSSPAITVSGVGSGGSGIGLSFRERMQIRADSGELIPGLISATLGYDSLSDIETINRGIVARAIARRSRPNEQGIVTPESIHVGQARYGSHVLANEEALADLRGLAAGDDIIGELAYTARFITGIYGYGSHVLFPGQPRTKLADASDMTSVNRAFWDANLGGLGGGYGEIFRRFIPDPNHYVERFNPLMNTMPDWLPERFRYGDPYTSLPKGEMRLPGRGYEALNELHPDQFGYYGAFDRFKILADIAPYSQEYKVWRDIASRTVTDPVLREEMREIRQRVSEQSSRNDFFEYRFIGRGTTRQRAVVDEVLNNNYFTVVGDDRVYRLAGITVGESEDGVGLEQYLAPGMNVVLALDKNPYDGVNEDEYNSVNAAVFVDGYSLNRQLLQDGLATKRQSDTSAAASQGIYTDFQILRGHVYEALAHAPIPYFQQKFFKIRDPLEHYKHDQIYGTSFASWTRPIDSFLLPGFERALMSDTEMAVGLGSLAINKIVHNSNAGMFAKNMSNAALMLTNRGAFIGGFLGLTTIGGGRGARIGAYIGAAAQAAGWLITRSDQLIQSTIGFGILGGAVGHVLKDIGIKKGAGIGAAAGALIAGTQTSVLDEGLLGERWIPERTLEKWEMQEYFDRLRYIKYSGLYEKAARKAYLLEGTDIKKLVNVYEKDREERNRLRQELLEYKEIVERSYPEGDERRERMLSEINSQLKMLEDQMMYLSVGRWGRAALIYKQAMDSTIYGLNKDASWAQLLRALPRNERDYFLAFAKEKDPKRREEILEYVSPYQRRALQIAWDLEPDKPESMQSFFSRHKLPGPMWSGWRPDIDLADVEVKTIENEGMLLSDFGYYESQLRDSDVINAPTINLNDVDSPAQMRANLIATLKGFGLTGVDVSVEPSSKSGIEVIANIARITEYNVQEKLKSMIGL